MGDKIKVNKLIYKGVLLSEELLNFTKPDAREQKDSPNR